MELRGACGYWLIAASATYSPAKPFNQNGVQMVPTAKLRYPLIMHNSDQVVYGTQDSPIEKLTASFIWLKHR